MKRGMDKLELNYILREINVIEKGFFRKIYKNNDTIKLKFNKGSIFVKLGKAVFYSESKLITEKNNFIEHLRSILNNKYLEKIYLKDGDRCLILEFNEYLLIFELFSKGNIILTEKNMKIVDSLLPINTDKYEFQTMPFSHEFYVKNFPEKPLGSTLTKMLGKKYKDFIIKKLNLEEKMKTKDANWVKINEEVEKLLAFGKPYVVKEEGFIKDFGVGEQGNLNSLSKACSLYYFQEIDEEKEKLKRTIEKIQENIKIYKREEREYRRIAEKIKENIDAFEELLTLARKNRLNEDIIKEFEERLNIKIIKIDKKERVLVVDV